MLSKLVHALMSRKRLVGFTLSTALLQAMRLLSELITMSLIDRVLFGYWKLWQLLFTYAPALQLGIINGAGRNIPFYKGANKQDLFKSTLQVSWLSSLAGSLLVGVIGYFVALLSAPYLDLRAQSYLPISLALATALWTFLGSCFALLRSLELFQSFSLIQTVTSLALLIALPLIYQLHLVGFLLTTALASLIGIALSLWILRAYLSIAWHSAVLKDLMAIGIPILLVGLSYSFLTTLDRVLIGSLMGANRVGDYSLAILTFTTFSLLPLTISQYFYPRISSVLGETGSAIRAYEIALRQIRLSGLLTTLAVVIGSLIIPVLVRRFLPEYAIGIPATLALLPANIALSFVGGAANWLNSVRKQRLYLSTQVLAIMLSLGFSLMFYALGLGITGIALGSSLAMIAYAIVLSILSRKLLQSMTEKLKF